MCTRHDVNDITAYNKVRMYTIFMRMPNSVLIVLLPSVTTQLGLSSALSRNRLCGFNLTHTSDSGLMHPLRVYRKHIFNLQTITSSNFPVDPTILVHMQNAIA